MLWREWNALYWQWMEAWKSCFAAPPFDEEIKSAASSASATNDFLNLLSDVTDQVLALFDEASACAYLSPGFARLTGNAAENFLEKNFYRCLHADDAASFRRALERAQTGDALPMQRFRLRHADGSWRWYTLHVHGTRQAEDGMQVITLLKDAKEAVASELTLKEARRRTELALKARSEFLNAMSHELRTPLNAILGFTQIMEHGLFGEVSNPQYREYLRHIRESGMDLLSQIDDIMEMADIDSGAAALQAEECDLAEALSAAAALHRHHAQAAKIMLVNNTRAGAFTLLADRAKLVHCIGHIIANSVRFTREGGSIALSAEENSAGEIVITVADTGAGMSAKKLQGLVSALRKEDSWEARNANGLGLGLALAKEYARLHGGYLTLESAAGEGTRVHVHLPPQCKDAAPQKVLVTHG